MCLWTLGLEGSVNVSLVAKKELVIPCERMQSHGRENDRCRTHTSFDLSKLPLPNL